MQIHKTESGYSHPEDLVPISEGNGGFIQIIGTKICANPTTVTGIARRFHTIIRSAQIYLIDFGCLEASESVTGWSCHGNVNRMKHRHCVHVWFWCQSGRCQLPLFLTNLISFSMLPVPPAITDRCQTALSSFFSHHEGKNM